MYLPIQEHSAQEVRQDWQHDSELTPHIDIIFAVYTAILCMTSVEVWSVFHILHKYIIYIII